MKIPDNPDEVFGFPCEYPVKAMGKSGVQLEVAVLQIMNKHIKDLPEGAVKFTASKGGNYTSITVTFMAQSKEQLDAIYRDLTACEFVLYAL